MCPCIDIKQPIEPQLAALEPDLDRHKVVGLKIYLSYQAGRANDPKLDPVYAFAQRHQLSVTFHTGLCSLVLPSDQDLEGSSARYIAQAAERYPDVNFIHWPIWTTPTFWSVSDCGDPRQPVYRCLRCL